jgi:hypothetical protein
LRLDTKEMRKRQKAKGKRQKSKGKSEETAFYRS